MRLFDSDLDIGIPLMLERKLFCHILRVDGSGRNMYLVCRLKDDLACPAEKPANAAHSGRASRMAYIL